MRNFRTIVLVLVGDKNLRRRDFTQGCLVTSEFIRDNFPRHGCLPFKQLCEEPQRCSFISAALHQNIDDVAVLIDRSPKILAFTTHRYKHLVQEPNIAQSPLTFPKRFCVFTRKLQTPTSYGFLRSQYAADNWAAFRSISSISRKLSVNRWCRVKEQPCSRFLP
jgi:hypothetical protein